MTPQQPTNTVDQDDLRRELRAACREGQQTKALKLLEAGAPTEKIMLYLAAQKGLYPVCEKLLQKGVPVLGGDRYGAVGEAIQNGYVDIVQLMIRMGVIQTPDDFRSQVESAVRWDNDEIASVLLEAWQASASGVDKTCLTKLLVNAAYAGHRALIDLLIAYGAEASDPVLVHYASGKTLQAVHALCGAGCAIPDSALPQAAHALQADIVDYLLSSRDFQREGLTEAIREAIRATGDGPRVLIVKQLLDAGADMMSTASGTQPSILALSAAYGRVDLLHLLLAAGAGDPDGAALCAASEFGSLVMVRQLLPLHRGETAVLEAALVRAVRRGHLMVVDELLASGASGTSDGLLETAVSNDHLAVVDRLLTLPRGQVPSSESVTAAITAGHIRVAARLIQEMEQLELDPKAIRHASRLGNRAFLNAMMARAGMALCAGAVVEWAGTSRYKTFASWFRHQEEERKRGCP